MAGGTEIVIVLSIPVASALAIKSGSSSGIIHVNRYISVLKPLPVIDICSPTVTVFLLMLIVGLIVNSSERLIELPSNRYIYRIFTAGKYRNLKSRVK